MSNQRPNENEKKQNLALSFQKCFDTPDGLTTLGGLEKFIRPDEVLLPKDSMGRIDPLQVQYNEGKRVVMAHIRAMLNKDINEIKQKEAVKWQTNQG